MKKHILLSLLIIAIIAGIIFVVFYMIDDKEAHIDVVLSENNKQELPINNELINKEEKMIAIISTNFGEIKLEFFDKDAPNTVANFIKLAGEGFYNGTKFHRVIPNFMIQGGDPLSKDDKESANWGRGGPGYTFPDEIHLSNQNLPGTISMANAGPDTNGSQFFINVADNSFLNDKHTVFGIVVEGMDVVKAIEMNPTASGDRPIKPVIIESITITN